MKGLARVRIGLIGVATAVVVIGIAPAGSSAAQDASHEERGWKMSYLPMPHGHQDARGYVTGTDSKGSYSGFIGTGAGAEVVIWSGDQATLHGIPAGFEFAATQDQNRSGTIAGDAIDYDTGGSQPFILERAAFRMLPLPDGFTSSNVRAMNNQGDIVGFVFGPESHAAVLWPGDDLDEPVVLELNVPSADMPDIDDDGTILLDSFEAGQYLWKDGALEKLVVPAGYTHANVSAIRNGRVVGHASSEAEPAGKGFFWRTPNDPRPLSGSATATEINAFGLIVGREPDTTSHQGPLAVWLGTYSAGRLPLPAGHRGNAGVIGDDGSIAGHVSTEPLDEGGRPVLWRYS